MVTWLLSIGWIITFLIVTNDLVTWQLKPECLRTRQRRVPVVLFTLLGLEGFALWSVIYPFFP